MRPSNVNVSLPSPSLNLPRARGFFSNLDAWIDIERSKLYHARRGPTFCVNFRWKKKIRVQERDMTMEKSLLQRMNTERQKRINDYKDRMNREIARMQSKTM